MLTTIYIYIEIREAIPEKDQRRQDDQGIELEDWRADDFLTRCRLAEGEDLREAYEENDRLCEAALEEIALQHE